MGLVSGQLDRRITLLRSTPVPDSLNEQVPYWAELATVWASKRDVSDGERVAAAEVGASITTRFVIRWSSQVADLNAKDRVQFAEMVYDISAVKEIDRRVGLEITAAARPDLPGPGEYRPTGFVWPFDTHALRVRQDREGTPWLHDFEPTKVAAAALAGPTYYADIATGNNANSGLSPDQKVKSIWSAIQKGSAAGVPFNVLVTAGFYPRNHGPTNSASVMPTQACAILATGGRVLSACCDTLTWTVNGSFANVYQATRSNVRRVVDRLNVDAYGDFVELAQVADLATCAAAENSWAQSGSTVYVNRTDNAPVTDSNTLALLLTDNMKLDATVQHDFYAKGFDFVGGQGGTAQLNGCVGTFIFEDCSAKFSGGVDALQDGFRVVDAQGLAAFIGCTSNANAKDGFNAHRVSAPAGSVRMLTINCTAKDNGRYTSQSNNGLTAHEDCQLIDLNGDYADNWGGNVHIIDSSQLWALGTSSSGSHGDTALGGGLSPQEFRTEHTARMWLDRCEATARTSGNYALRALDTSKILTRRTTVVQGIEDKAAGATIGNY